MGKLKTTEQISKDLEAFKAKQLRKKEKERERKIKIRQEEYKTIDKKLKLERDEASKRLIRQLQELNPKKEEEEEKADIHIPRSRWIAESNIDLYSSREEIMEAEKRGEGKINWEFFDELIRKTKDEIHNLFKEKSC